jgi:hypothetical protein
MKNEVAGICRPSVRYNVLVQKPYVAYSCTA